MAFPKVKLSDDSGNTVAVDTSGSSNALKVSLLATPTIDIGDVEVIQPDVIASAAINVTDSAVRLTSQTCKHVDIMANLSNTGIVYVGGSNVAATTGIALYPGDVYSVDIANLNAFYILSTVSGDDINVQVHV